MLHSAMHPTMCCGSQHHTCSKSQQALNPTIQVLNSSISPDSFLAGSKPKVQSPILSGSNSCNAPATIMGVGLKDSKESNGNSNEQCQGLQQNDQGHLWFNCQAPPHDILPFSLLTWVSQNEGYLIVGP